MKIVSLNINSFGGDVDTFEGISSWNVFLNVKEEDVLTILIKS